MKSNNKYIIIGSTGSGKSSLQLPGTLLALSEYETPIYEIPFSINGMRQETCRSESLIEYKLKERIHPFSPEDIKDKSDAIIFCDEAMYMNEEHRLYINESKPKKIVLVTQRIEDLKWLNDINEYNIIDTKEINNLINKNI